MWHEGIVKALLHTIFAAVRQILGGFFPHPAAPERRRMGLFRADLPQLLDDSHGSLLEPGVRWIEVHHQVADGLAAAPVVAKCGTSEGIRSRPALPTSRWCRRRRKTVGRPFGTLPRSVRRRGRCLFACSLSRRRGTVDSSDRNSATASFNGSVSRFVERGLRSSVGERPGDSGRASTSKSLWPGELECVCSGLMRARLLLVLLVGLRFIPLVQTIVASPIDSRLEVFRVSCESIHATSAHQREICECLPRFSPWPSHPR